MGGNRLLPPQSDRLLPAIPEVTRDRLDLASAVGWVLAVAGFMIGSRTIADNSFLTHLATGELILDAAAVPTTDPYSLLGNGQSWTVQSWLVSLVYAVADRQFGGWSIRVLHGLVTLAITRGLWRLTSPARQLLTRVGLVGLTLLVGTSLWTPRPLLFGLLAMVVVLQVAQGMRPRWWLLPVFWFWVNAHGSFVLGAVVLGAIALGAAIDTRAVPRAELKLVLTAAVGCLAGMIGPLGWRLLWFPLHLLGRGDVLEHVAEWGSPSFRSPVQQLFLVSLALIAVGASHRAGWRALLPALVFFVAGLMAARNLGVGTIVIVAMMAPSLQHLAGSVDGATRGRMPRLVVGMAAVVLALALWATSRGTVLDLEEFPTDEVTWLDARSLVADSDVRLLQRDYVGNYLTLRYGPEARVFMDDRYDFHSRDVLNDHAALLLGGDMAAVVDRNGFDVALWATSTPFHRWIEAQDDWEIVRSDESWFVACRTTSAVHDRCTPSYRPLE